MPIYQVFHLRSDYLHRALREDAQYPFDHVHYEHVANVEAVDVEHAFELTNSIDRPWVENEGVHARFGRAHQFRSTSTGDILRQWHNWETWLCAYVGWVGLGKRPDVHVEDV